MNADKSSRITGTALAEAGAGLAAALLGGAGLAFALFGNILVSVSTSVATVAVCATPPCPSISALPQPPRTVTVARSLASGGLSGPLKVFATAVVLALVVMAVGALAHAFANRLSGFVLLCVTSAALFGLTVLTGFSIGLLFLPADALAVAAVTLGAMRLSGPAAAASA